MHQPTTIRTCAPVAPAPAFPYPCTYASTCRHSDAVVCEGGPARTDFLYSERHLQCVWYDDALRPHRLSTADGEHVRVEHPGTWNLEPGPDFLDAMLRIGPERRRTKGDVEIHVRPGDWLQHGHRDNPRYARVVAHVTYFAGSLPQDTLPRGAVEIAMLEPLRADPYFCFESIDVTAYPFARRIRQTPCGLRLNNAAPPEIGALLEAAGRERLRIKAERIRNRLAREGQEQLLYEEVLGALGYRHNTQTCRRLARRIPVQALRQTCRGCADTAYALLLGMAGLLPCGPAPDWDNTTKGFVRRLWDLWWRHRAKWESKALPPDAWRLHALRPQNHPRRRLAAAAALFGTADALAPRLLAAAAEPALKQRNALRRLLDETPSVAAPAADGPRPRPPESTRYWRHRLRFSGPPHKRPVALIGTARAGAILTNVVIPFLAATRAVDIRSDPALQVLPAESGNRFTRHTASLLLGPDHNPSVYRTGLRQQGLLQIFHDFCLTDRSRCRNCRLPRAIDRYRKRGQAEQS